LAGTPIVDVNYDAGETVVWPRFVDAVTAVVDEQPAGTVVLTGNYGELGALARYAPDVTAYSGHNALASLGPPPDSVDRVVAVGFDRGTLADWFDTCDAAAAYDNGLDVDNEEQGVTIWVCSGRTAPWSSLWPRIRHLG